MSAPSEIRCMAMSSISITHKVPATVSNRTKPMMTPERTPINSKSTTNTMATAAIRLSIKLATEARTESDCIEITCRSMPSGRWLSSSAKRALTASPISTTLPPVTFEIPKPIAR
ncbi:Uncharacterised protein [Vibrio cholerae]|nr:Uncharacterised protein [Vibrio cholerae]CSA08888.1 Uncharacterised protein [Vibrio cholerae]CSB17123.1 Uncharacterised protein [Vibrio cholerae]CSB25135.1 Uncharacterised protein [Vibrio cholerae]CSB52146.1 Uncharacterised protein [Vibrio cholerae]